MMDTNSIIRTYLTGWPALTALVGARIYAANPLPENATLPCISFFTRGGRSVPQVPEIVLPSVQFSCWADDPIEARSIYRALYDCLQGHVNSDVVIDAVTYHVLYATEDVQGQDIQDVDIPGMWRVLAFFTITIRT